MFVDMLSSIRRYGVDAPIYISIATRCRTRQHKEIQEAQAELVDIAARIYPGPNTDNLEFSYRYDGCHFTDEGLEREAGLWLSSLGMGSAVDLPPENLSIANENSPGLDVLPQKLGHS